METTENNKLIAEFLGIKYIYDDKFDNAHDELIRLIVEQGYMLSELKYDSDWNWLMSVVEKIVNLKDTYAQERQKVFNSISPNLLTTYNACIEFIKWYNLNKLNN